MNIFSDFFTKKNKIGNSCPLLFLFLHISGWAFRLFFPARKNAIQIIHYNFKKKKLKAESYIHISVLVGVLFKNIKISAEQFSNMIITINAEIGTNTDSYNDKDNSLNVNNLNKKEP